MGTTMQRMGFRMRKAPLPGDVWVSEDDGGEGYALISRYRPWAEPDEQWMTTLHAPSSEDVIGRRLCEGRGATREASERALASAMAELIGRAAGVRGAA